MKRFNQIVFVVLSLTLATTAWADPTMEFSGATDAGIDLVTNANTDTTLHIQASAGFLFDKGLELVAVPSITFRSIADGSSTTLRVYGEVRYNLSTPVQDSFFIQIGPGFALSAPITGATKTHFAFDLAAGKRFRLAETVCWVPEINYQGTTTARFTSEYQFIPFQFSIFL